MDGSQAHQPDDEEPHSSAAIEIQIMSDLHLETPKYRPMYAEYQIEPEAPYLALLGDIGNVCDGRLFDFIEQQLQQFLLVFFVFGNHEPYQDALDPQPSTYDAAISKMKEFEDAVNKRRQIQRDQGTIGQFVFLDKRRFDITETVTILGCTLFSNIAESQLSPVSLFVSDFSNITGWTVEAHNAAHRADLDWLNEQVSNISRDEPHRNIIIFTHYSPTMDPHANDPRHLDDSRGVQTAFVTDLESELCWTAPRVKVWAFGHTHYSCDYVDGATGKRVVANQKGYGRDEAFDFDGGKTITVGTL